LHDTNWSLKTWAATAASLHEDQIKILMGSDFMTKVTPNYIEMNATDLSASKQFYQDALGFSFTDYGDQYAAVEGGPVQIGIAVSDKPAAPMPTFETDDLEASLADVKATGAKIEQEIFQYPGGRRFECLDPAGNRIAIYKPD